MVHLKQVLGQFAQALDIKSLAFAGTYLASILTNISTVMPILVGVSTVIYNGIRIWKEIKNRKSKS